MLGDISRDNKDICYIEREDGADYIGHWVSGFGFVEVKFPKVSTRDLTDDEIEFYDGRGYNISGGLSWRLRVRDARDDIGRWADDGGRA
jgi:hypothetical protein